MLQLSRKFFNYTTSIFKSYIRDKFFAGKFNLIVNKFVSKMWKIIWSHN